MQRGRRVWRCSNWQSSLLPAIIFAVLGDGGIAGMSFDMAEWLVIGFIILAIIALILERSVPFL